MNVREPAVAGQFYPGTKDALTRELERLIDKKATQRDVIAAVVPHAGYVYSGVVAGNTFSRIRVKETAILIGPNHTGMGSAVSIMASGTWRTPLGDVAVNSGLAKAIIKHSRICKDDSTAHRDEHSLEVEIPFLQYFHENVSIVPITIFPGSKEVYTDVASAVAAAVEAYGKDKVLIIASSDMTHYESQESAQKKDNEAIQAMLKLDEDALLEKVQKLDISMCGAAPAAIALMAAKRLGAQSAELVQYQTSGEVSGDYDAVVGYAGIIIF